MKLKNDKKTFTSDKVKRFFVLDLHKNLFFYKDTEKSKKTKMLIDFSKIKSV